LGKVLAIAVSKSPRLAKEVTSKMLANLKIASLEEASDRTLAIVIVSA
jgi:hypothetical protein